MKACRKLVKTSILTAIAALVFAGAALAWQQAQWNYGFDGCSWKLTANDVYFDPPWSTISDENGGCRYLTVWATSSCEYHKVGPTTAASTYAALSLECGSNWNLRGVASSWETDRTQDSGWKTCRYNTQSC